MGLCGKGGGGREGGDWEGETEAEGEGEGVGGVRLASGYFCEAEVGGEVEESGRGGGGSDEEGESVKPGVFALHTTERKKPNRKRRDQFSISFLSASLPLSLSLRKKRCTKLTHLPFSSFLNPASSNMLFNPPSSSSSP